MEADDILQFAREIIAAEASAVAAMQSAIGPAFEQAARSILSCPGSVLTTGIGKAGHIARKLAATLASTGTPSHFLSATDAAHGDLGAIRQGDLVLVLSHSGESDEILRLLSLVKKLNHPVIAMTASAASGLGKFADIVLEMGKIEEACPLRLAPSASTTAMLALGDALALSVMKLRNFQAEDFALFHPAGQIGRQLIRVGEAMTFRKGENLPMASDKLTVGQVLHEVSSIKRRSGAVVLVNDQGKLTGIFADSDLRRLVTDNDGSALSKPIFQVMTQRPKRVRETALASEAMAILRQFRIDELPVVDAEDRPLGLIDVQDLVILKMLDVEPNT
ncbi:MAG: KpsF/GutQ family sugar-phosphate isomerase [Planctomycetota bacterium]|nr:KpsF/GutQ family sugar-phosphate isomerase [Planctomycetota bacterium]